MQKATDQPSASSTTPTATPVNAVTTLFTPPASCTSQVPILTIIDSVQVLFPDLEQATSKVASECFPSQFQPKTFISPAPFCQVGYTAACGTIRGPETAAVCCPEYVFITASIPILLYMSQAIKSLNPGEVFSLKRMYFFF
jgi:hypothetical protein